MNRVVAMTPHTNGKKNLCFGYTYTAGNHDRSIRAMTNGIKLWEPRDPVGKQNWSEHALIPSTLTEDGCYTL